MQLAGLRQKKFTFASLCNWWFFFAKSACAANIIKKIEGKTASTPRIAFGERPMSATILVRSKGEPNAQGSKTETNCFWGMASKLVWRQYFHRSTFSEEKGRAKHTWICETKNGHPVESRAFLGEPWGMLLPGGKKKSPHWTEW